MAPNQTCPGSFTASFHSSKHQCTLRPPLRALKRPSCELCAVPEARCLLASPEEAWMPPLRPPPQPITAPPLLPADDSPEHRSVGAVCRCRDGRCVFRPLLVKCSAEGNAPPTNAPPTNAPPPLPPSGN
ncbi:unnamed protein product [Rangifer tarandus platyrhynchus]|uniref:Uncharacterized protein n=1 Tax=Rangifer tarandus platyrhynchus TaxID=3082113 RepID=A0AC59YW27_RANTA